MTRRERAAMGLALEVLRERVLAEPCRVPSRRELLEYATILQHGSHDLSDALLASIPEYDGSGRPEARARLALYLRTRLRAERGDCGRTVYRLTGRRCRDLRHNRDRDGRCRNASCGCYVSHRRIRSLWEMAPSHGGGR